METTNKDRLLGFIFFLIVLVILNISYSYLINISISEEKTRYRYLAINEANYISSCIDKVVVRTYTVREMVSENYGETDFFDKVAGVICRTVKNDTGITLRNIAVAPDGIVKNVYPYKTNESLTGFNFLDASRPGNKEAVESFRKEKTIITNPFSLIQGGVGMAARTPVFIEDGDSRYFWGLVTATMDFDDVLKAFNLENFTKMQVKYRLWFTDDNGNEVVLDSNSKDIDDFVSESVNVLNLKWNLDVFPENGWHDKEMESLARIAIAIISLLLSALVLLMFKIKRDGNMMKMLAERDSLTQCYSRHYLNSSLLDVESGEWKHPENNYSVAIVDVDKFKSINDVYGHTAGDRSLISIAKILSESVVDPEKDRVIRFGGDEFLVFYSNIERKELRIKFQNILSAVEQIKFPDIPDLKLGVSIGVAIPENTEDKSYSGMMKKADNNLYKVKENGRNNYIM